MLPAGLREAQNIGERKHPFQYSRPPPHPVNAFRNMQTYLEIYMAPSSEVLLPIDGCSVLC